MRSAALLAGTAGVVRLTRVLSTALTCLLGLSACAGTGPAAGDAPDPGLMSTGALDEEAADQPWAEFYVEHGGALDRYREIGRTRDCALVQRRFDEAVEQHRRESSAGRQRTAQREAAFGYRLAALQRGRTLECRGFTPPDR